MNLQLWSCPRARFGKAISTSSVMGDPNEPTTGMTGNNGNDQVNIV